jgi:thymidylate synthase
MESLFKEVYIICPKHDLLHKFPFNMEHRYQILKYLSLRTGFEIKDFASTIEIEKTHIYNEWFQEAGDRWSYRPV